MDLKNIFWKFKDIIQTEENYVPRDYQTIGGMWTVDTYKYKGLTLTMMDEGWTIRIAGEGVDLINRGDDYELRKGNISELDEILSAITE